MSADADGPPPDAPKTRMYAYANSFCDRLIICLGFLTAIGAGAAMPAFSEIFSQIIDGLGGTVRIVNVTDINNITTPTLQLDRAEVHRVVSKFSWIMGVAGGATGFLYFVLSLCFAYVVNKHICGLKSAYFRSLLHQSMEFFDSKNKAGNTTEELGSALVVISDGLRVKAQNTAINLSMFVCGFGLGYWRSWRMALVITGCFPMLAISGASFGYLMGKSDDAQKQYYEAASNIANEALNNIKSVLAFHSQLFERKRYDANLDEAMKAGMRKALLSGLMPGMTYFVMFGTYAIAFIYASYLIQWKLNSTADVIACFFSVLMGAFGAGIGGEALTGFMLAVETEGKLFETINRSSPTDIRVMDQTGKAVDKSRFRGQIEFRGVLFGYVQKGAEDDAKPSKDKKAEKDNKDKKDKKDEKDTKATKTSQVSIPRRIIFNGMNPKNLQNISAQQANPLQSRGPQDISAEHLEYYSSGVLKDKEATKYIAPKDQSFVIRSGQKVGLIGESGCGKSTIVSLLLRLYDPSEGAVLIDGEDLRTLNLRQYRSQIAVVNQRPSLFDASVFDNIALGDPSITLDIVKKCCEDANIADVIENLPNGYNTRVGRLGGQLSGGQKQRIAIARALARNPQILLLDEATAALDRASEMEVQRAIDNICAARKNMTVVIVAHRLATVQNCDCIVVFTPPSDQSGEPAASYSHIAEAGTHTELMEKDGLYATLYKSQNLGQGRASLSGDIGLGTIGTTRQASAEYRSKHDIEKLWKEVVEKLENPPDDASPTDFVKVVVQEEGGYLDIFFGMFCCILASTVFPVYAVVFTKMTEVFTKSEAQKTSPRKEADFWCAMYLVSGACALIGWTGQFFFFGRIGGKVTRAIRKALFAKLLTLDPSFFDTPGREVGAVTNLLSTDAEKIHAILGPRLGKALQQIGSLACALGISFAFQPKIAAIALAATPMLVISNMIAMAYQFRSKANEDTEEGAKAASIVEESLMSPATIAAFNLQERRLQEYETALEAMHDRGAVSVWFESLAMGISQFNMFGLFALLYWYGGTLIRDGEADFRDVMMAAMSFVMCGMGMADAENMGEKTQDADAAAKRVWTVLNYKPADLTVAGPLKEQSPFVVAESKGVALSVDFQDVSFTYPERLTKPVVENFTLKIGSGQRVGICGPTGCGKSSITNLLMRFYHPNQLQVLPRALATLTKDFEDQESKREDAFCGKKKKTPGQINDFKEKASRLILEAVYRDTVTDHSGHIEMNDVPYSKVENTAEARRFIGYVSQETTLFTGTIVENIMYNLEDATAEDVLYVSRIAAIHQQICGMVKEREGSGPVEEVVIPTDVPERLKGLPAGYFRHVGARAMKLSGGQRQRICLARALLKIRLNKGGLLLLDEATSDLDVKTEAEVQANLEEFCRDFPTTIVAIAHRLTTIQNFDHVVVMNDGVIVEEGNPQELKANANSEFSRRLKLFQYSG